MMTAALFQLIQFQILWGMSELHDDCTLCQKPYAVFIIYFSLMDCFALEGVYSIQKNKAFIIALVGPGEQLYIIKLQNLYIIKG